MRPGVHRGALFLGFALLVANGFSSGQFLRISRVVMKITVPIPGGAPGGNIDIRNDLFVIMGELIFLTAASVIADSGETAESAIIMLFVGLWLVWLMQNGDFAGKFIKTITPKQTSSNEIT